MNDQRPALLQAVLDSPEDDFPRLVYADHLEEYGNERDRVRAEFIRCQLRLHSPGVTAKCEGKASRRNALCRPVGCDWCSLRRQERRLLDAGSAPRGFNDTLPGWLLRWTWRRGFLGGVALKAADYTEVRAAWLFSQHPVATVVVADRVPHEYDHGGNRLFGWYRATGDQLAPPYNLPAPLWDVVAAQPHRIGQDRWADFPSPHAAMEALLAGCLAFGHATAQ